MKNTMVLAALILMILFFAMMQLKDRRTQCSGKNPYYTSMGKMFACDNYRGDP